VVKLPGAENVVRIAYPPPGVTPRTAMTPSRRLRTLLIASLAALVIPTVTAAAAERPTAHASYVPGEVIVRYERSAGKAARARVQRATGVANPRVFAPRTRALTIKDGQSVAETLRELRARPEVATAAPNTIASVSSYIPSDPGNAGVAGGWQQLQWNFLAQTGVNAPDAWQRLIDVGRPGGSGVIVAVLDTGVAYEDYGDPNTGQQFRRAPDWGDTRFLPGYDFFNGDTHPNDDEGHGTHVASTIAEATNNDAGMAGLAFGCAIMPVKVLGPEGVGSFFDVADGIDFAIAFTENGERPVKVINLSLSSPSFSQTAKAAIDRAVAAGVLVVAAAGNTGGSVRFPADQTNVVGVGALDALKELAVYSNRGPEIDLVAPGGDCETDDDHDGTPDCVFQQTLRFTAVQQGRYDDFCYCGLEGTSMATPHVAAAAALLYSQGFTDAASVRAALEQTAERLGDAPAGGRNNRFGNGLIRPASALPGFGLNVSSK